jgi:hypothetical protein
MYNQVNFHSQDQKNIVQIWEKCETGEMQNPLKFNITVMGIWLEIMQKVHKFAERVKSGIVKSKFHCINNCISFQHILN